MIGRTTIAATVFLLATSATTATSIKGVSLKDLVKEADVIALVRIVAADAERFEGAVYKADVVEAFKGVQSPDTIYFGPYVYYRLGAEYVVLLRSSGTQLDAMVQAGGLPWPSAKKEPYLEVMYAGYSVLAVDYTCVIPKCDYGVSIAESQVYLPKTLDKVHDDCAPGSRHESWVRRDKFLDLLRHLVAEGN